jgi:hypothetical protein
MNIASSNISLLRTLRFGWISAGLVLSCFLSCCAAVAAQQPSTNAADAQREAMRKLAFLAGRWSGPITISHGPGKPLHRTQTENIQYKLDGLVMLVEGESRDASGKVEFRALATISFDDVTHAYRFRAYNDGHYIDTELTVLANGFSWGFASGPAHVANTMHLTDKGEWGETTDVTFGSNPPSRSVDMLLKHLP